MLFLKAVVIDDDIPINDRGEILVIFEGSALLQPWLNQVHKKQVNLLLQLFGLKGAYPVVYFLGTYFFAVNKAEDVVYFE